MKLKAVGLEHSWFRINAFGDEAPTRPDLVALAMQRYQANMEKHCNQDKSLLLGIHLVMWLAPKRMAV